MTSTEILVTGAIGVSIYLIIFCTKCFKHKYERRQTEDERKLIQKITKDKQSQTDDVSKTSSSVGTEPNKELTCVGNKSKNEKKTNEIGVQTEGGKGPSDLEKKDKCFQTENTEKVSIGTDVCIVKKRTEDQCLQTDFPKETEVTEAEEDTSKVCVQPSMTEHDDVIDGYPPPEPPHLTKSEVFSSRGFSDVKQHALQVPEMECNSYESLLRYLCGNFESDFQRVYAIFCWIINRQLPINGDTRSKDSPVQYLYLIMQGKGTSADLMSKMCREIGIPCVMIHGFEKNGTYEVGEVMTKEKHSNCWNAVYIEKNWWFVYCKGAQTSKEENCTGFITDNEKQIDSVSSPLKALSQDFYFLTEPSIFIHTFYPFDDRWQLLSKTVSLGDFESRPFLHPAFHFLKLEFINKDIACTVAISETFNLKIRFPHISLGRLSFDYKISSLKAQELESSNMKKYSLHYIIDDVAYFDFRFPAAAVGEYKLQIFGKVLGHVTSTAPLCEFKLICEKGIESLAPLPVDADVGWGGTSAKLEERGVKVVSHANGLYPWVEDEMKFDFAYPEHSDAKAELRKIGENEKHFEKSVNTEKKGHNVNVSVHPPLHEQGEFVLKIYIRDPNASEFINVCNYLLERTETQSQRKARERLLKLLKSENAKPIEVQKAKEEFQKSGGKDFGEVAKAERKMHHISLRKALEELRTYHDPPDSVLVIMHATYIILGKDEKDILEWKSQKRLLRKIEVTLSEFDVKHVSADSLTRAKDVLKSMDSAKARKSSAAAAKLYEWAITIIKEMEEQNKG
ncbi:lim and transglutaminase domain protein ltd-1-like isoform X2 [Saccostrea cucullata]|uniref:lim and transglutaminase domain protein ltd-1-like isoform X2 n=1 Tax=Saccostrea cuccullata TaxID=36930 RepID=UPI002ED4E2F4